MSEQLAAAIAAAGRIALFTGAGISTESGIPDFRSPGGVWTRKTSILFQDFMDSEAARREAWQRRFEGDAAIRAAQPNRGHRAVEALVRSGRARVVVTQNIDGLHQQSGLGEAQVVELHGNTTYAACLECGTRHEIDEMRAAFSASGTSPRCRRWWGCWRIWPGCAAWRSTWWCWPPRCPPAPTLFYSPAATRCGWRSRPPRLR
jgi:NAD-dependent deacetylase